MCGICGIITSNQTKIKEDLLLSMMQKLKHRGPDDEGVFIDRNVGLGFVRLSIIDLSPLGHQPMFDATNRYVIIFNGEIYNYIEIREELIEKGYQFKSKTDTEVILYSYIEWGEECLHRFNGMWAFVIYDLECQDVFASRDRFGVKPFYYYETDTQFAFASEIPPLLDLLPGKPLVENQLVYDFMVFNKSDHTSNTFFQEIKKLPPGYLLTIRNSKIRISQWYNLREKVKSSPSFKNETEYLTLLTDSINLRLRSDVPVGVCLSGGLDSSAIASILLDKFNLVELNTFSAVYQNGQIGDESEYISEFSAKLHNMIFVTPDGNSLSDDLLKFISANGEPIPDTSPYAQYKVMELARKNVVVILNGQGADEQLAGYHYFFGVYFKELLIKLKIITFLREIVSYLIVHRSSFAIKTFLFYLLPKRLKSVLLRNNQSHLNRELLNKYSGDSSVADRLYQSKSLNESLLDHFESKLEHLLKWEDRNSMIFSLETRLPFLDYRLVEKTLASSSQVKISNGTTKKILRNALVGILPEKIRLRKSKIGFGTPLDEWLREPEWQKLVNEIFDSESFNSRGWFNVEKTKELYKRHIDKKTNASREIWKCIHLELWYRVFID